MTLPAKRTGSCGIIDKLSLNVCSPTDRISTPSIVMLPPPSISASRNKVSSKLLLPDPVLPTTPKVVPGGIVIVTCFKTKGEIGLYRMDTFLNWMPPFHGHPDLTKGSSLRGPADTLTFASSFSRASPTFSFSLGILGRGTFLDSTLFGSFPFTSVESRSVSSVILDTLIIWVSKSVKHRTAHVRRPVMESACVRPQPADPALSRPARVKKMEASADINTTIFPKVSKRIDSHRSKAFTDENTDRLSSERERCLEDQSFLPFCIDRMVSTPRRASPK
mmetsp:Transcript_635/g.1157  ORF Transcript_635/g.1157 Transcript_635/m.1157 type:complete len:277 (-) Transcript_635:415-1245(-)